VYEVFYLRYLIISISRIYPALLIARPYYIAECLNRCDNILDNLTSCIYLCYVFSSLFSYIFYFIL